MYRPLLKLPEVSRDASDILKLFGEESREIQSLLKRVLRTDKGVIGVDLEFSEPERYKEVPTVLGVSDGHLHISVPFDEGLPYFEELRARHPNQLKYVGHAFTSADKFAFRQVGVEIPNEDIVDTIILHSLVNSHLNKSGQKVEDGDGKKRGRGFMNLWTFLSLYTDLPNYKDLFDQKIPYTGEEIDVWTYNGLDSYSVLPALPQVITQARLRGVDKLYPLHQELAYVLGEMTRYGVQIDREYVSQLQGDFEKRKKDIEDRLPFNPKSNPASLTHFKEKGIVLPNWQEDTIREAEEEYKDEELTLSLEYKELGNGTDRWFAPITKNASGNWVGYMDERGKVHPRLGIFTSTGRMNCSGPNLQNISVRRVDRHTCECGRPKVEHPQVGHEFKGVSLGKMVRRAIIASPGYYLLMADISNGENRVILHLGGHRVPDEIDLHTEVVKIAGLTPDMEFSIRMGGPRQAAKSVAHAGH